jgi:hypothetical protein
MELEWILHAAGREFGGQPRPELRQIGIHSRRVAERQLLFSVSRRALSDLNVLLRGEHVPSRLELRALST